MTVLAPSALSGRPRVSLRTRRYEPPSGPGPGPGDDPFDAATGILRNTPLLAWPRLQAYAVGPDLMCVQAVLGTVTKGSFEPFTNQVSSPARPGVRTAAGNAWWRWHDRYTADALEPAFAHVKGAITGTTAAEPKPPADVDTAASWRITSSDHPAFGSLTPSQVSRKSSNTHEALVDPFPNNSQCRLRHRVYLKSPTAFQAGRTYTATFTHPTDAALNFNASFLRSDDTWSEAVHVVQEGHAPAETRKLGFVSIWLGAHPTAAIATPYVDYTGLTWELVDDAGGTVQATGTLAADAILGATHEFGSNPPVHLSLVPSWKADFSAFATSGTYRLRVAGIGCSYPFPLTAAKWRRVTLMTTRAATIYQSASRDRVEPYTAPEYVKPLQHRPAGTVLRKTTARIEATSMGPFTGNATAARPYSQHTTASQPTYTFAYLTGASVNPNAPAAHPDLGGSVTGGWDDAADWDCRPHGYNVCFALLDAYEMSKTWWDSTAGDLVTDNPRNLAAGVPSVLREVHNFLMFFRQLQLAYNDTGGIAGALGVPAGVEYDEHPAQGETSFSTVREAYVWGTSVVASYFFCAAAAQLAHCLGELASPPQTVIDDLTTAAVQAWLYAEGCAYSVTANGVTRTAGEVRDDTVCQQYRAQCLLHLHRLTGTASYHTSFLTASNSTHWSTNWIYLGPRWPANRLKDSATATSLLNGITSKASGVRQDLRGGFGLRSDGSLAKPQFSNNSPSMPGESHRLMCYAHYLTGTGSYLDAILEECHYGLGANPANLCYVHRLGTRWCETPTEVDYWIMGVNPTPGRCVFSMDCRGGMAEGNLGRLRPRVWPHYEDLWPAMEQWQNWHGSLASVHEFGQQHLSAWPLVASYLAARLS